MFELSLVTSVAIRSHIKTSVYRGNLVDKHAMGMFGDKYMYSSDLSFVKLLTDTLVTGRPIASF